MTVVPRTGEAKMQPLILQILNDSQNGEATIEQIITEIPKLINLTKGDLAPSKTRDGEALWEQIVRNVRSHADSPKNYIYLGYIEEIEGGYRITDLGRKKVKP